MRGGFIASALCAMHPDAQAEGFRNPPPGTFSLARAGGRIAQIDNAEAAYHNPANLVDLDRTEIELAPGLVYFRVEHEGGSTETTDPVKYLPHAFFTTPIIPETLAFGLALTTPFGISNEWDRDEGRFIDPNPATSWRYATPYFSELITINANPSLSWKINDKVSVGAGLNVFWSQVTFRQYYPPLSVTIPGVGTFTSPETQFKAKGDGFAFGGNAGVTFSLTEKQKIAVTYRSPFSVNYEGDLRFENTPLGASESSDFDTKVRFPTIISFGYGIEITETIRLEADVEWLEFSRFNNLAIDAGANNSNFPEPNRNLNQDWDDTFTVGLAGDWRVCPDWTVRGGYQYYETPVPDHTFSPTIPDSNQHAITAGLGYANGHHAAELAYGYIIYEDRNITDDQVPNFNGRYEMDVHLFAASYAYRF